MIGLLITTIVNHFAKIKAKSCSNCTPTESNKTLVFQSIITCSNCGHSKKEIMPADACQFFYECEKCYKVLKPKEGDCCVFAVMDPLNVLLFRRVGNHAVFEQKIKRVLQKVTQ